MKWEYLSGVTGDYVEAGKDYVFIKGVIRRVTFNELGEKGWELVQIVGNIAYFKRPKIEHKKRKVEYLGGKIG